VIEPGQIPGAGEGATGGKGGKGVTGGIEILAPGGSFDGVKAAVAGGANAVYIGLPRFSARSFAQNISLETLHEVTAYCHLRGVRVYVAVNTIIRNRDIKAFLSDCEAARNACVDAFIVQDIGAARLLKCFGIPIHASTQMTVHSPEGVRFAAGEGFSRVILARECSGETINALTAIGREAGIETEVFVHGALCMSVSGQCYMSVSVGGRKSEPRSANCGSCAGICRLPFSCGEFSPDSYALSLKDMSILQAIPELEAMGVASAKIEGRMKRPEYVFAAVKASLAQTAKCGRTKFSPTTEMPENSEPGYFAETLQSVFSRTGFTDGYYENNRNDMFGNRRKEDVLSAEAVLPELSGMMSKAITADVGNQPVRFEIMLRSGKPVTLTARFETLTVTVTGDIPKAATGGGLTSSGVVSQLSKTGGTPYLIEVVVTDMDEGMLFLPKSAINALRREALSQISEARLESLKQSLPQTLQTADNPAYINPEPHPRTPHGFVAMISDQSQLETALKYSEFVITSLDITESIDDIETYAKIIVTPPRFFPDVASETDAIQRLRELRNRGVKRLYAQNVAHIKIGYDLGFIIHGGYGLNIENEAAVSALKDYHVNDITPCIESHINDLLYMSAETLTPYAYGRFPLMLTRNCPLEAVRGCKGCDSGNRFLTDRTGRRFPVRCHRRYGYVEILNADRMSVAGRYENFPADRLLLDFFAETPNEMTEVFEAFRNNTHIPADKWENITRGLY
jgi:putative protease